MNDLRRRFRVLAALSLGPAVANSFARFAYALLLPAMRDELHLTYAQAGALNTANALGYLAGALIAVRYVARFGNRRFFCVGMVVTMLAIIGCGLAADFVPQLVLRAIAGVSGALVFICGAVLASSLFPDRPDLSRTATAVYFGGAGAGILLSGAAIPWLLATWGERAWRKAGSPSASCRSCSPSSAYGARAGSTSRPARMRTARGRSARSCPPWEAISCSASATSRT
jgi:MFS family permease